IRCKGLAGTLRGGADGGRVTTLRVAVALDAPEPMLAQLASRLPSGALWRYEPKLDGFRGLLEHAADGELRITSRNRQDLTRWFPGIARAGGYLPAATVLDGELVVVDEHGRPNFGALQARLTMTPERIADAVVGCPAILIVFDVLQLGGNSLVDCPLDERRRQLEDVLVGLHPCLQLVLANRRPGPGERMVCARSGGRRNRCQARRWALPLRTTRLDQGQAPAHRGLRRHRRGRDDHAPTLVLALRHADGNLHLFGTCRQIPSTMRTNRASSATGWPAGGSNPLALATSGAASVAPRAGRTCTDRAGQQRLHSFLKAAANFLGLISQCREEVKSDHVLVLADRWLAWVEQAEPADEG